MSKTCQGCIIKEKYKYWSELPATKQQFFKFMPNEFEHQMKIPQKFMECSKVPLSPWCTLIGPSKNRWRVRLSTIDNERSVFTEGWGVFVRDHGVEVGDFLVFRYVGDSSFEVSVFDKSCCERESSYFATNANSRSRRISCTSSLHVKPKDVIDVDDEQSCGSSKGDTEHEEDEQQSEDDYFSWEDEDEYEGEREEKRVKRESRGNSSRALQRQKYFISNRRELKRGEEVRAHKMAMNWMLSMRKKKNQGIPMFEMTMLPTHVYKGFHLTIPKEWAVKHMLRKSHEVELCIPNARGRSWSVGCRWTRGSLQCQLRAKWALFVLENNLEEHDSCVFELIHEGNQEIPIFNVHIFRVVDHIAPLTVSTHMV